VNMPMGSNKKELKKITVKIIKCKILKLSEINVFFSFRTDKFS